MRLVLCLSFLSSGVVAAIADPLPRGTVILNETQGQSLGVGARGLPIVNATPPAPGCAFMPNDKWKTRGAGDMGSTASSISGVVDAFEVDGTTQGLQAGTFGETHVTAEMAQLCRWKLGLRYVGRSSAATGKDIASIGLGTRPYANGLADVQRLSALAEQAGGAIVVQGISFIHGESDRTEKSDPSIYINRAKQLVDDTNRDWRSATRQTQPIRYGIMQMSANALGRSSPIVQAQYDLALGADPHPLVDLIGPRYPFPLNNMYPKPPGDGLHLSSAGYVMMGEYIAKWRRQTFINGAKWLPLYPTEISFSANRQMVNLFLHIPKPPLAIDTDSLPQGVAENYGLSFHDDCGAVKIAVNGVAISGPKLIQIRLNGPSSCSNPKLEAAWDGVYLRDDSASGAWTNIRDSDQTISRSGNKLYNWLVSFSLPVLSR